MIIKSRNTLHERSQKTRLTQAESAGTNAFRVENTTGLTTNWAIQIGETGAEQTEVLLGTATAIGSIDTTANSNFEHPADTPVYFIKYDQVVFEVSTAGTAGTAAPHTDGTITYQPDNHYTRFDDTDGTSTYAYKTYFRNSTLNETTIESDWITSAGFTFYSLGKLRERVKGKLWDSSYLDDDTIDDWLNEWRDQMANEVIQTNEDYSLGTEAVAFGTNGLGTVSAADLTHIRRVWVTYNGNDQFQSSKQNVNDYLPNEVFSSSHPFHSFEGDDVIHIKPEGSGGTATLTYYQFGTTMVNDTDLLPLTMRPYTASFVDYVVAQALYKDEKDQQGDRRMAFANQMKKEFVTNIAPRDRSGPTMIDIVEPISGQDRIIF